MAGCITFPLTALNQFPVGLYGRSVKRDQHLYLPGPRKGLFNWNGGRNQENHPPPTESIFDALSFIQCGFGSAVPIYGVNGFTEDHIELLVRSGKKKAILAMDSDAAGKACGQNCRNGWQSTRSGAGSWSFQPKMQTSCWLRKEWSDLQRL